MKIPKALKPNRHNLLIPIPLAIIIGYAIHPHILNYYSNFSYCLSLDCPTAESLTNRTVITLILGTFIIGYLIIGFLTNKKKGN